jgi:hypothetical protein
MLTAALLACWLLAAAAADWLCPSALQIKWQQAAVVQSESTNPCVASRIQHLNAQVENIQYTNKS